MYLPLDERDLFELIIVTHMTISREWGTWRGRDDAPVIFAMSFQEGDQT